MLYLGNLLYQTTQTTTIGPGGFELFASFIYCDGFLKLSLLPKIFCILGKKKIFDEIKGGEGRFCKGVPSYLVFSLRSKGWSCYKVI